MTRVASRSLPLKVGRSSELTRLLVEIGGTVGTGEKEIDGGADTDRGVDPQEAAGLPHERINLRDPQSRPGTGLGSKERVEDPAPDPRVHARTIVSHPNPLLRPLQLQRRSDVLQIAIRSDILERRGER